MQACKIWFHAFRVTNSHKVPTRTKHTKRRLSLRSAAFYIEHVLTYPCALPASLLISPLQHMQISSQSPSCKLSGLVILIFYKEHMSDLVCLNHQSDITFVGLKVMIYRLKQIIIIIMILLFLVLERCCSTIQIRL